MAMTLKVLVADDNLDTRTYLKQIIEDVPNVKVVSVAENGKETIRQAELFQPDVLVLDIDMPEINGVDAARALEEIQPGLSFVFVTAFPDYALDAFELYSFDYILKPFDEKRIQKTIRRLRDRISKDQAERLHQLPGIIIEVNKQKIFVHPEEIIYIESRKHKVFIKTEKVTYLTAGDLNKIEQIISPHFFFRCHKSFIVNLKKIKTINPSGRSYEIILSSGDRISLSREREKKLRKNFGIS
jgi:DNA-binding LytR/AlgR family response regulator